jgi:hypothetical protein
VTNRLSGAVAETERGRATNELASARLHIRSNDENGQIGDWNVPERPIYPLHQYDGVTSETTNEDPGRHEPDPLPSGDDGLQGDGTL